MYFHNNITDPDSKGRVLSRIALNLFPQFQKIFPLWVCSKLILEFSVQCYLLKIFWGPKCRCQLQNCEQKHAYVICYLSPPFQSASTIIAQSELKKDVSLLVILLFLFSPYCLEEVDSILSCLQNHILSGKNHCVLKDVYKTCGCVVKVLWVVS